MALKVPKNVNAMLKEGMSHSAGLDEAVYRNIQAVTELTNMTRTSYGPNGRNKMVINHLEKLFVTNDAATIMKELEVVHPAARMLVLASHQQEQEMGDATNYVVVLAGELLTQAEALLKMGIHPSEIVDGYDLATKHALALIPTLTVAQVTSPLSRLDLTMAIRPAIMSKQYGYEDFLTPLVLDAVLEVIPKKNPAGFNVDSVRVVKILGGSVLDSSVVRGMVFGREPEGSVLKVEKAKIAIFSCPLETQITETKGTVLINNAQEMLNFSKGEESQLELQIREIASSGATVVVTGSSCSDLALHFLNRHNLLVIKILSKFELRRLCRVTGATVLTRLGAPTAEELGTESQTSFHFLGNCDVVETVEIGGDRCTVFRQEEEKTKTVTIVLRGSTMNVLDDVERAIDDAVATVKAVIKDNRLVAGAGAFEIELARSLRTYAELTPGLSQYAIHAFANSLDIIPTTLLANAGLDSTHLLASLYTLHETSNPTFGVDIESDSGVMCAVKAGIYDVLAVKMWAVKLAAFSAVTVLSVDQIIMSKQAGGPKVKENKNWDEDN